MQSVAAKKAPCRHEEEVLSVRGLRAFRTRISGVRRAEGRHFNRVLHRKGPVFTPQFDIETTANHYSNSQSLPDAIHNDLQIWPREGLRYVSVGDV
jgi:hypothetical protein